MDDKIMIPGLNEGINDIFSVNRSLNTLRGFASEGLDCEGNGQFNIFENQFWESIPIQIMNVWKKICAERENLLDRSFYYLCINKELLNKSLVHYDHHQRILFISRTAFSDFIDDGRKFLKDLPTKSELHECLRETAKLYRNGSNYIQQHLKAKKIDGKTYDCIWIDVDQLHIKTGIEYHNWLYFCRKLTNL